MSATPKRYVAIDLKSSLFPKHVRAGMIDFYVRGFNSIDGVRSKWAADRAEVLFSLREKRSGSITALFDQDRGDKIIGLYLVDIVPGCEGVRITEPEVLVDSEYRRDGLGKELAYVARLPTAKMAKQLFGERPSVAEAQTYKKPDFPRKWWCSIGYKPEALFSISSDKLAEVLERTEKPKSVKLTPIGPETEQGQFSLDSLAAFISDPSVCSTDDQPWEMRRAKTFLRYNQQYNPGMSYVATDAAAGVIGLVTVDAIPRRKGSYLHDVHIFAKQGSIMSVEEIWAVLLRRAFEAARSISLVQYGVSLAGLEVPERFIGSLNRIIPSDMLEEDDEYIEMIADNDTVVAALKPDVSCVSYLGQIR